MDVFDWRCLHYFSRIPPGFNVKGSNKAAHCEKHDEYGMVNVNSKRCRHEFSTKRPNFTSQGIKPAYGRQHAQDGMVDVRSTRC